MRRALLLVVLLLLAVGAQAQTDFIKYSPPANPTSLTGPLTITTGPLTLSGGQLLAPNGSAAAPSLGFSATPTTGLFLSPGGNYLSLALSGDAPVGFTPSNIQFGSAYALSWGPHVTWYGGAADVFLTRDAANTLALRNGTAAQQLNVYNSFTTYGSNYGMFSIVASATGTDLVGTGAGATVATGGLRSIQGSKQKTLTDAAAAVSFARVAVATNSSAGGTVLWSAMSTDATSPLTQVGSTYFAGVNTAGTVTCTVGAVGTPITAYSRVNTLACTISAVTSTTNCDLQVTCTDNLAGDQTPVFSWRLDMPVVNAVVVQ